MSTPTPSVSHHPASWTGPGWWSQNNRAFMRYFKQLSCRGKRKKCLDIFASFAQLWMPGVFQWARVASGQRGSDGRLSGLGRGNPDQTGSQTGERNHSFLERIIWFSSTDDIRDLYSLVCSCDYYQTRPPTMPPVPRDQWPVWPDLVTGASLALVPRSPVRAASSHQSFGSFRSKYFSHCFSQSSIAIYNQG